MTAVEQAKAAIHWEAQVTHEQRTRRKQQLWLLDGAHILRSLRRLVDGRGLREYVGGLGL